MSRAKSAQISNLTCLRRRKTGTDVRLNQRSPPKTAVINHSDSSYSCIFRDEQVWDWSRVCRTKGLARNSNWKGSDIWDTILRALSFPSHSPYFFLLFHYPMTWWTTPNTMLIFKMFSQLFCYFFSLRFKYSARILFSNTYSLCSLSPQHHTLIYSSKISFNAVLRQRLDIPSHIFSWSILIWIM